MYIILMYVHIQSYIYIVEIHSYINPWMTGTRHEQHIGSQCAPHSRDWGTAGTFQLSGKRNPWWSHGKG